jgi:hypothetical protein
MNTPIAPEAMTAEDRRQSWINRELTGYANVNWDYGKELLEILEKHFRVIEKILGKEEVAPHLFAMLPGPDIEGATWEEAFGEYLPLTTQWWAADKILDRAAMYGFYGVCGPDVSFGARQDWVTSLARDLEEFCELLQPDPQGVISVISQLALSRYAIDHGEGDVDLQSLALFGGVTEGRIRNILSSSDSGLEKVGQRVTAASAAAWLKGRKEFFASIWHQPDEVAPEVTSTDFADEVVFVPVAADGSFFHPGLARGGKFTIGAKGEEVPHATFADALAALQMMATPRWRRPNDAGNWGIVSGRDWKRVERHQLFSM